MFTITTEDQCYSATIFVRTTLKEREERFYRKNMIPRL